MDILLRLRPSIQSPACQWTNLCTLACPWRALPQKLFALIVSVCDNHHKNLSRLLYSVYAHKIGIQGCGTKLLTRHAPSGELNAKRILALLAGNCFGQHREEMLPSFLAICIIHSGAVSDRPVRNYRIRRIASSVLGTGCAQSPTAQQNCQNEPHDRPHDPLRSQITPRNWGRNSSTLGCPDGILRGPECRTR